jgi:nucleoside transporter
MGLVKTRLSVMMILQYAIWGVWLPQLAQYLQAPTESGGLGFSSGQVGILLGLAASIGAVTAPFIAGQFADRYFSTERFLAALILLGGFVKYITAGQTSYGAWLGLSILYSVLYMPTLSLTNSIAFAHLDDVNKNWPKVRVMGTFGWIAAGWIFPMVWLQTDLHFRLLPPFLVGNEVADSTARIADTLRVAGVLSVLYAMFCFALPRTPPKKEASESLAFAKAFRLLRHPSFALLVLASLPISIIHQVYFMQTAPFFTNHLGMRTPDVLPAMTVGQFAEIFVMWMLGWILSRLGFRWTIALGGLAYILRYAIWGLVSIGPAAAGDGANSSVGIAIAVSSQALHGFCYSCFFATAYIYTERIAEADIRNSAQTVFGIIILGVGPVLAGPFLAGLAQVFGTEGVVTNFSGMWLTLAAIAAVTTVVFAAMFRDETAGTPGPEGPEALTEEVMEA